MKDGVKQNEIHLPPPGDCKSHMIICSAWFTFKLPPSTASAKWCTSVVPEPLAKFKHIAIPYSSSSGGIPSSSSVHAEASGQGK